MNLAILAFVLTCTAVAQDSAPPPAREWGKRAGSFQLSISAEKTTYVAGEAVVVTVILKNISGGQAALWRTPSFGGYDIDVRVPFPRWIPFSPRAVLTSLGEKRQFPPGGHGIGAYVQADHESSDSFELNALYEMSALGEYQIVFSRKLPLREFGDPYVTVTSNEIKLTIVDKPK